MKLDVWDMFFSRIVTSLPYFGLHYKLSRSDFETTQKETLKNTLSQIRGSEYARQFGLTPEMSYSSFASQAPIVRYHDIEPILQKVYRGETEALFHPDATPKYFAMTSGTTGARKYIPLTPEGVKALQRSFWILGVHMLYQNPGNQLRGILTLASTPEIEQSPNGIPCGEVTGLIASAKSPMFSSHATLPSEVHHIRDPLLKYYLSLRIALLQRNLRIIMTATPATLTSLAGVLGEYTPLLIKDIYDGSCAYECPQTLKPILLPFLKLKDRARAKELERIFQQQNSPLTPADVWPNLQVAMTWLSGSFQHYKEEIRRLYRPYVLRDMGLSASEGQLSLPIANNDDRSLLNIWNYVFEFSAVHDPTHIIPFKDLSVGETYRLIVTTPSGLVRYDIQDLCQFSGHWQGLPMIRFTHKDRDFLDLTGEKLSSYQVSQAFAQVCKDLHLSQAQFFISASAQRDYFILILPQHLEEKNKDIALQMDLALQNVNECYLEHRQIQKLKALQVIHWPQNKFTHKLQEVKEQRQSSGEQFKPPLFIENDKEFIKDIA